MNDKEALKDIVCALIASGDYTYRDDINDFDTAYKLGWRVTWYGSVLKHAESILDQIKQHDLDVDGSESGQITTI